MNSMRCIANNRHLFTQIALHTHVSLSIFYRIVVSIARFLEHKSCPRCPYYLWMCLYLAYHAVLIALFVIKLIIPRCITTRHSVKWIDIKDRTHIPIIQSCKRHYIHLHLSHGCGNVLLVSVELWPWYTVYPKKYAHGFVVLCFVVVM